MKRTEGISTTDIVGRLLMMSKEHIHNNPVILNFIYLLMSQKFINHSFSVLKIN